MIHSRPGYHPVHSADGPKQILNADMQPAITKSSTASPSKKVADEAHAKQLMQAKADKAWERMKAEADSKIIVNPAPSATPITTDPHGEDLLS